MGDESADVGPEMTETPTPPQPRPRWLSRALLLVAVAVGWWLVVRQSVPDLGEIRGPVVAAGPWAPATYVTLFVSLTLVAVPRNVLTTVGAALFGLAGGVALSWRVPLRSFSLGTALGIVPGTVAHAVLGAHAIDWVGPTGSVSATSVTASLSWVTALVALAGGGVVLGRWLWGHRHADHQGLDHQGLDRQGRDRQGLDRQGRDRQGLDRQPTARQCIDRQPTARQCIATESTDAPL